MELTWSAQVEGVCEPVNGQGKEPLFVHEGDVRIGSRRQNLIKVTEYSSKSFARVTRQVGRGKHVHHLKNSI